MTKLMKATLVAMIMILTALGAQAGNLVAPAGYHCVDTYFQMPEYSYFGGLDILPNSNFVIFDGHDVREINMSGNDVGTSLYHFTDGVFASFVKYNAADNRIYFGESSTGAIKSIALTGGDATDVGNVAGNYDIDFSNGMAYVASGSLTTGVFIVSRLDMNTGIAETIAQLGQPSGPLVFDSNGNLIYGLGDNESKNTPRDQQIIRWSATQVATAGDNNVLGLSDGCVLANNVAPCSFVLNASGNLLFSETVSPSAIQLLGSSTPLATTTNPSAGITYLCFNSTNGSISAAVSWYDTNWTQYTVISTLVPVPEPSSLIALGSLIALAIGAKPLRIRRKH